MLHNKILEAILLIKKYFIIASKFSKLLFSKDPKVYTIRLMPSIVRYITKKSKEDNSIQINNNKKLNIEGNSLKLKSFGCNNNLDLLINNIRITNRIINNLEYKIYLLFSK